MGSLFFEMRGEQNLFSAWRHVKRSALYSTNNEIKGLAAEFEHRHQRYLKRFGRQLRESRFVFDPVEGILKDRKKRQLEGKDPRPITIASLKNRIVQRAILQVLQPREIQDERDLDSTFNTIEDPRLGKINQINHSRFGVGGLLRPFGGVRPAINLIAAAINNGSSYYYRSDIKSFFTKIPTQRIVDFVREETKDQPLAEIFARGLEVHLKNEDELLSYASLFPSNGIGVAQGSSLSAFAGNVLLYEFDHELNQRPVTAVRYIDDLVIVASSESALREAIDFSKKRLKALGFSLYDPRPSFDKAAKGRCADAFNFLGCTIQPNRCVPSKQSIRTLVNDTSKILSSSKAAINKFISKSAGIDPSLSKSAVLQSIGKKIYGWQKSFSFCTEAQVFHDIDTDISKKILDYEQFVIRKTKSLGIDQRMHIIGIPSMEDLFNKKSDRGSG